MPETATAKRAQAPKRRFAKIFDGPGTDRLEWLLKMDEGGKTARKLWLFLFNNADHLNAVVTSLDTLAAELGCHVRSVMRAAKVLEDAGALCIIKVGTARAYVLNPAEVFRSADTHLRYCSFGAKVLVGYAENDTVATRIRMLRKARETEAE
jgi:hypothetical protein